MTFSDHTMPENNLTYLRELSATDFTDVTSEQVMLLTPTMTAKDVIELSRDRDAGPGKPPPDGMHFGFGCSLFDVSIFNTTYSTK